MAAICSRAYWPWIRGPASSGPTPRRADRRSVIFDWGPDDADTRAACRDCAGPAADVSAPPPELVPPAPARSPVAAHTEPLPHSGVRDHAAADPGGPRRPQISGVAGALSFAGGPGTRRRPRGAGGLVSARVQYPAGAAARHRAGGDPSPWGKDSAHARRPARPSGARAVYRRRGAELCLSPGRADPRHQRPACAAAGLPGGPCHAVREIPVAPFGGAASPGQRLRLQPGADGFRGDRLQRASPPLSRLPALAAVRAVPARGCLRDAVRLTTIPSRESRCPRRGPRP